MKKKLTRSLAALVIAVAVLLPVINVNNVNAQSTGLGINPRKELTVEKGATKTDTLTITNPFKDSPVTLNMQVIDFSAKDQTGVPKLSLNNEATTRWSLKKYINVQKQVTLKAGETKSIPYSVTIPSNLGAGTYYSAIQYQASSDGDKNVSLDASATTLVFVSVPGDAKEQMNLLQLGAFSGEQDGNTGDFKLFYFGSKPKVISYVLKNEGNVAESPVGAILLKNSFTGKTTTINNANPKAALALIDQERRFDACIKTGEQVDKSTTGQSTQSVCESPSLTPGRYTVTLSVFYGQDNGKQLEITGVSSFWYLPIWFVVVVIIVILLLVTLVWWIVSKVRRSTPSRRR